MISYYIPLYCYVSILYDSVSYYMDVPAWRASPRARGMSGFRDHVKGK